MDLEKLKENQRGLAGMFLDRAKDGKIWIKAEMEHTNDPAEAREIVIDHLCEHGPKYYPELLKMEEKL